ncbi:immunity 53 family protein [Pyxidicoccus sp. 3LG]
MDALERLQAWYSRQCNGEWEDFNGVIIDTLDNPGWRVTVNLKNTSLEAVPLDSVKVENSREDWWVCQREGTDFRGYGDPAKLRTILEYFLSWAERTGS